MIALAKAEDYARCITSALGGFGVFGVELFIKGDDVWFSEVSPRPHDTGMVTLMSQNLSEFALHARAILGLPIPVIRQLGPTASAVLLVSGQSQQMVYHNIEQALAEPDTEIRLFGKTGNPGRTSPWGWVGAGRNSASRRRKSFAGDCCHRSRNYKSGALTGHDDRKRKPKLCLSAQLSPTL